MSPRFWLAYGRIANFVSVTVAILGITQAMVGLVVLVLMALGAALHFDVGNLWQERRERRPVVPHLGRLAGWGTSGPPW